MAGRILVTGSLGLLGAAVVDELVRAGREVVGLDRRLPDGDPPGSFRRDDLSSCDTLAGLMAGCRGVVHCAAISSLHAAPEETVFATNVTTTANVLLAAERAGVARVVYASSQSALGFAYATRIVAPDRLPVDETHPCRPVEAYGLSKRVGEQLCEMVAARSALSTVALRFPVIWAHGNFAAHTQKRLGDPAQAAKSQWAYVDRRDAARACHLALDAPPGPRYRLYNIGARWPFDLDDPGRTVPAAYGLPPGSVDWLAPDTAIFDCGRAAAELKFKARWKWSRTGVEDLS